MGRGGGSLPLRDERLLRASEALPAHTGGASSRLGDWRAPREAGGAYSSGQPFGSRKGRRVRFAATCGLAAGGSFLRRRGRPPGGGPQVGLFSLVFRSVVGTVPPARSKRNVVGAEVGIGPASREVVRPDAAKEGAAA